MTRDRGACARTFVLCVAGTALFACQGATGPSGPRLDARAPLEATPVDETGAVVILIDSSASRVRDLDGEVTQALAVAGAVPRTKHVFIAAYDEDVELLFDGAAGDVDLELGRALAARGALGTSNATRALGWALDGARPGVERVVLFTDGVDDGEPIDAARLVPPREGVRIETVPVGSRAGSAAEPPRAATPMAALLERARPLPVDATDGMSLDPLADALPERRQPAAVTVEMATDDVAPRSAGPGAAQPSGVSAIAHRLPPETIQGIVRRNFGRFRGCYREAVHRDPRVQGKLVVRFEIGAQGHVRSARAVESEVRSPELTACVVRGFEAIEFPEPPPDSGPVSVSYPIVFTKTDAGPEPASSYRPASMGPKPPPQRVLKEPRHGIAREVYDAVERGEAAVAVTRARRETQLAPTPGAFLLLGDAARANGDAALALRAYTSVLDAPKLEPSAFGLVGARLLGLGADHRARAEASLLRALSSRPGDASALELLASSRAEGGDLWGALQLLDVGLGASFLRGVQGAKVDVVRETFRRQMSLYAAAFAQQRPAERARLGRWLADVGAEIASGPGLTIAATFDGGAADVDLVVRDASLLAASKATPSLAAGGALAGDAPTSPGIELFAVEGTSERRAHPFEVSVELAKGSAPFAAGMVTAATYEGDGRVGFVRAPFFLDVPEGGGSVLTLNRR